MSMMFSSKSSGGGVVAVRLAMTAIVPSRDDDPTAARGSGGGEAAVHEDDLPGHVVAGPAGQEHRDALEVPGLAVAPDHRAGGERRRPGRVAGHLPGQRRDHEAGGDRIAAHATGGPRL